MWRFLRTAGCAGALVIALANSCAALTAPLEYEVTLRPEDPQPTTPVVLSCAEGALCRGSMELRIDGTTRSVTVVALIQPESALMHPGSALIQFDADVPLFVSSNYYGIVLIDRFHVGHEIFSVDVPAPDTLKEARRRSLIAPVERAPREWIATIDVDVRLSQ